jgi:hypothetical protein
MATEEEKKGFADWVNDVAGDYVEEWVGGVVADEHFRHMEHAVEAALAQNRRTIEEEVAYLAYHRLFHATANAANACTGLAHGLPEEVTEKIEAWERRLAEVRMEVYKEMTNLEREEMK